MKDIANAGARTPIFYECVPLDMPQSLLASELAEPTALLAAFPYRFPEHTTKPTARFHRAQHLAPQDRVDPRLVALPVCLQPIQHIGIDDGCDLALARAIEAVSPGVLPLFLRHFGDIAGIDLAIQASCWGCAPSCAFREGALTNCRHANYTAVSPTPAVPTPHQAQPPASSRYRQTQFCVWSQSPRLARAIPSPSSRAAPE